MLEKMIEKAEAKILHSLGDRLHIETEVDAETLSLRSYTYWDDVLVQEQEFDLTPLVDAIVERLQ
jgi:hypothetical protein